MKTQYDERRRRTNDKMASPIPKLKQWIVFK